MGNCHACGLLIEDRVGVRDLCPRCSAYLHCCRNCRLYSPAYHNHCASPTTEPVGDVEAGNFCEEFEFTTSNKATPPNKSNQSRFDELFGH